MKESKKRHPKNENFSPFKFCSERDAKYKNRTNIIKWGILIVYYFEYIAFATIFVLKKKLEIIFWYSKKRTSSIIRVESIYILHLHFIYVL